MHYRYCPQCGSKLVEKEAGDDGKIPFCASCEKYWFDSFASCVIILVANEHREIAMLHQSYLSEQYATFVAGFMKPGETAEETAVREVQEELGLSLLRLEYAGTYWFAEREQLMHGFIGFAKKQPFRLSGEVNTAEWVPAERAPKLMFPAKPGNAQHPMYQRYLALADEFGIGD